MEIPTEDRLLISVFCLNRIAAMDGVGRLERKRMGLEPRFGDSWPCKFQPSGRNMCMTCPAENICTANGKMRIGRNYLTREDWVGHYKWHSDRA